MTVCFQAQGFEWLYHMVVGTKHCSLAMSQFTQHQYPDRVWESAWTGDGSQYTAWMQLLFSMPGGLAARDWSQACVIY